MARPKKRKKKEVEENKLVVQTRPEVEILSQEQVNEITNQTRIRLVMQARHEIERVIKMTETLDLLQDKYQEKILQYIVDHDNEDAVKYLPMMIDNLTKSLEKSYAIINQVVGNDKIMNFQLIQNNITDSTLNVNEKSDTDDLMNDPVSRERVRSRMFAILKDLNSMDV